MPPWKYIFLFRNLISLELSMNFYITYYMESIGKQESITVENEFASRDACLCHTFDIGLRQRVRILSCEQIYDGFVHLLESTTD